MPTVARRTATPPPPPPSANLTAEQMREAIPRLQRRIEDLRAFDVSKVVSDTDPNRRALENTIESTLQRILGADTVEYNRYSSAATLRVMTLVFGGSEPSVGEIQQELREQIERSTAILQALVREFEEELEHVGAVSPSVVDAAAPVGDLIEPLGELDVQIVEVAEGAGQEEIFPNVAERPFDLPLGLGAVGFAGLRQKTVMGGQIDELGIVGDAAGPIGIFGFADHGGLHAIVEDAFGHATQGLEGGDVAAQNGLQILAGDETPPHHPAVAEHQGEQPDDPF